MTADRPDLALQHLGIAPGLTDATMCHRSAGELRRALAAAYQAGLGDGSVPRCDRTSPNDDAWGMAKDGWLMPGVMRK